MVDTQSATTEIRQGKKEEERRRQKLQLQNIISACATQGGHNNWTLHASWASSWRRCEHSTPMHIESMCAFCNSVSFDLDADIIDFSPLKSFNSTLNRIDISSCLRYSCD